MLTMPLAPVFAPGSTRMLNALKLTDRAEVFAA